MVRPCCSPELAVQLARNLYGLPTDSHHRPSVQELDSYDDRNFHLKFEPRSKGDDVLQVILKVHNAEDSAQPWLLEAQTQLMNHVSGRGIPCNRVLPSVRGRLAERVDLRDGASPGASDAGHAPPRHCVRLLSYVPGKLLVDAHQGVGLHTDLGRFLACLDLTLRSLDLPALRRAHDWDMAQADATIARLLPAIHGPADLVAQVGTAATAFATARSCFGAALRSGIVHADANERNILVDDDAQQVSGIIDFGDAMLGWLVAELAVAVTYVMLLMADQGKDPFPAATAVLCGYEEVLPLLPEERQMLQPLVAVRLALSLCKGLAAAAADPANAAYLLDTQRSGRQLLQRVMEDDPPSWITPSATGLSSS